MEKKINYESCEYKNCPCCKDGLCKNEASYKEVNHTAEIEKRLSDYKAYINNLIEEKGLDYAMYIDNKAEKHEMFDSLYDTIYEALYVDELVNDDERAMLEGIMQKMNGYLNIDCEFCGEHGKINEILNELVCCLPVNEDLNDWDNLEGLDYDNIYGDIVE